jgi:hypothetical protein
VVSTLGEDLGGSFLLSGPFIAGFGLVYFEGWPPKICFTFAIFNFSSGVISFFFYSGFPGGITVTGPFICGFSYFVTICYYFFTLNLSNKLLPALPEWERLLWCLLLVRRKPYLVLNVLLCPDLSVLLCTVHLRLLHKSVQKTHVLIEIYLARFLQRSIVLGQLLRFFYLINFYINFAGMSKCYHLKCAYQESA